MATIKEVAKLANVSIGTVSNVLNGKTQNEELIGRVEEAMQRLSYRPDAFARNLKSPRSSLIGAVLPNVTEGEYADFLSETERLLRGRGYGVLLKLSRNNRQLEQGCIESCLEQGAAGILLYSQMRHGARSVQYPVPVVLVSRSGQPDVLEDRVVISCEDAFGQALEALRDQGCGKVGLVIGHDLSDSESLLQIYSRFYSCEDLVKVTWSAQERGYQAFFELYTAHPDIGGVVAGSYNLAQGVKKAMETLEIRNVPVVVIKESSWIEDEGRFQGQISVSQKLVARRAVEHLMGAVQNPNLHEKRTEVVRADFDRIAATSLGIRPGQSDLRFAMFDCASARSLGMLKQIYERKSGIKVHFDLLPYNEMEELLYDHADEKNPHYDGFMMDITWLEGLVESGLVQRLDGLIEGHEGYLDGFVDGILEDYGQFGDALYAVPFMSGAQLMFYQKNLFENKALQRKFRRMYGEELQVPKTWAQFNLVAEFFTRSRNPQSPVSYGASIPSGANIFTTIGFLMRLWSYGGNVFDEEGRVALRDANAVAALRNLVTGYGYTSTVPQTWDDSAREFMDGESAMIFLFDSDARNINNYTQSRVAGNIGFALVPGGTPVLGGWSLGLNRYGRHRQDAERFLLWACGSQNGIPLSLLGGSTLHRDYFARSDLESIEPWKPLILKSYRQSRKRGMPEIASASRWKNIVYTSIIPHEIERARLGELSEAEAIEQMHAEISRLTDRSQGSLM